MSTRSVVIGNIRLHSQAGYYIGSLCFEDSCPQPNDRDSAYFPSEELLEVVYPDSISLTEALSKAEVYGIY